MGAIALAAAQAPLIVGNGRDHSSFVDVPRQYQGGAPQNIGLPNLTARIPPPTHPQPEEEQGVGRGPGERWEHHSHDITLNPWWHLERPGGGPLGGDVGYHSDLEVGVSTPPPQLLTWQQAEQWERMRERGVAGGQSQSVTVAPPGALSQTTLRRLPLPGAEARS